MAILAEFVALAPQLVCLKKLKDSKWLYGNSIQNPKNISYLRIECKSRYLYDSKKLYEHQKISEKIFISLEIFRI